MPVTSAVVTAAFAKQPHVTRKPVAKAFLQGPSCRVNTALFLSISRRRETADALCMSGCCGRGYCSRAEQSFHDPDLKLTLTLTLILPCRLLHGAPTPTILMADHGREVVLEPALPLSRPLSDHQDDSDSHSSCALQRSPCPCAEPDPGNDITPVPLPCNWLSDPPHVPMEELQELDSGQHLSSPLVAFSLLTAWLTSGLRSFIKPSRLDRRRIARMHRFGGCRATHSQPNQG